MEEIWKDIQDYDGYQVSNIGRVRTYNKTTFSKKHGERHWKNRILKFKGNIYATGYRVDLWKNGKPRSFLVARLVAFTFFDKDINDRSLTVNHKDGNRLNNHIENLELIILKENIQHGFNTGLYDKVQNKIKLINKDNGICYVFRSMSKASEFMNYHHGYVSCQVKNGIYENEHFRWELL